MNIVIDAYDESLVHGQEVQAVSGHALFHYLTCLGYDAQNPPLADFVRQLMGLEGDWLILSPIHWKATHNDALIVAAGHELGLSSEVFKTSFEAYSNYLKEEHGCMVYYDEALWLLRADNRPKLDAKPVFSLVNQSLMPDLSSLDTSMYWQKFFTEGQMFFANSAQPTVLNGLWAWGSGTFEGKKSIRVCADIQWMDKALMGSSSVIPYSSSVNLATIDLLLLDDINTLTEEHKAQLAKRQVHWYWNNHQYTTHKNNWYTRLWRRLRHAD